MDRVLRIAAVSVEAADIDRLRQLVEAARPHLAAVPRWTDAADADVLLIDSDSLYGHMEWIRAQGAGRRIIGLSARVGGEGEIVVRRPFAVDGVQAALAHWIEAIAEAMPVEASATTRRAVVGEPAAKPLANPVVPPLAAPVAPVATPVPDPAPIAQAPASVAQTPAPVVAALAAAEPVAAEVEAAALPLAAFCGSEVLPRASRLVLGDAPAITIDNETGVYFGPPGLKALALYCRESIARNAWEPVSPLVLEGLRAAGGGLPTGRLVWLNALHAGAGQLVDIPADARVRLAKWPQIEREFPKHFRIATVMMKGFANIDEIAAQSGAPVAEVADFVNACRVAGTAEVEPAALPAATPADSAAGGLLGRLGLRGREG